MTHLTNKHTYLKHFKLMWMIFILFILAGVVNSAFGANIQRPTTPTGLSATPVSTSQIDLKWSKADRASQYRIFRDGRMIGSTPKLSFSSTRLSPLTTYRYQVSAVNFRGMASSLSSPVSATTLSNEQPIPDDSNVIGYLGCSMTQAIGYGLDKLGSTIAWLPVPDNYGGGGVWKWAQDFNNPYWTDFKDALAAQPTKTILWELCSLDSDSAQETYENALKVVNQIKSLIPGVTLYVSAQPSYDPVSHVCIIAGSNGPTRMGSLVSQLVTNGEAKAGPTFGPLLADSQLKPGDSCHPNDAGEKMMAQQLIDFFTGVKPPPPPDFDTEVLGQSQTTQWGPYFTTAGFQFRIKTGSGYMNWLDPSYSIWSSPEAHYSSDGTPLLDYADIERVIITVGKAPQDVGVTGTYESLLEQTIDTVRDKYPNVQEIVLQPLAAGPNEGLCVVGGKNVLTTVNIPAIKAAIATLTAAHSDVKAGIVPLVDNCNEFADSTGHLTDPAGRQDIAGKVMAYYANQTPPPEPTAGMASGVYVVDSEPNVDAALASPTIDGLLIRSRWTELEPASGYYNFTRLCANITKAHNLKKKVSLVLYTNPPPWLIAKLPSSELWTLQLGKATTMAVPWSETALAALKSLVTAEANFTCGGFQIKSHPAVAQVDTNNLALSIRDVPPGATLDKMTKGIVASTVIWHDAFAVPNDPKTYYHSTFPLGRTSTAVSDSVSIIKEILKLYPMQAGMVENWGVAGIGNSTPLMAHKQAIIQSCGYYSNSTIKCSDTGRADNTPKNAYDKVLKPLGIVKSLQIYATDVVFPAYTKDMEYLHSEMN